MGTALERLPHRVVDPRPPLPGDDPVPEDEWRFHFLAGRPCLDLVATVGERWRRAIERLRTPEDAARWTVEAGLAATPPAVTEHDLAALRRLRSAIGHVLFAWADGAPLPDTDLQVLNAAAAHPDLAPALGPGATVTTAAEVTPAAVRSTIARDAIALVGGGDPARLRECAAEDCSLLFHDDSRPGRRRWCSMAECGSRHKAAAYRRRARS